MATAPQARVPPRPLGVSHLTRWWQVVVAGRVAREVLRNKAATRPQQAARWPACWSDLACCLGEKACVNLSLLVCLSASITVLCVTCATSLDGLCRPSHRFTRCCRLPGAFLLFPWLHTSRLCICMCGSCAMARVLDVGLLVCYSCLLCCAGPPCARAARTAYGVGLRVIGGFAMTRGGRWR